MKKSEKPTNKYRIPFPNIPMLCSMAILGFFIGYTQGANSLTASVNTLNIDSVSIAKANSDEILSLYLFDMGMLLAVLVVILPIIMMVVNAVDRKMSNSENRSKSKPKPNKSLIILSVTALLVAIAIFLLISPQGNDAIIPMIALSVLGLSVIIMILAPVFTKLRASVDSRKRSQK
jgi:uncharacterized membrane protein YidH (DUF202 family)